MSYLSLNIGGKDRGLKFNQMTLITFSKTVDYDNYMGTAGYALVYAAMKANNYVKQVEDDFTFEQVCDWVEVMSEADLIKVREAFQATQAYKDMLDKNLSTKPEEKMTKKKPTRTKRSASK